MTGSQKLIDTLQSMHVCITKEQMQQFTDFEQILEDSKRQEAWCVEVPIMITGFSRLAII